MSEKQLKKRMARKYHHLTPLEAQAIFDARAHGARAIDLAMQYGVSRQSIYNAMRIVTGIRAGEATGEGQQESTAPPRKRRRSRRVPPEIKQGIADLKRKYPAWGVKYLREHWLKTGHPPVSIASIYRILREAGLRTRELVETTKTIRIEQEDALIREISKQDLSKDLPVKRQQGPDRIEDPVLLEEPAAMDEAQEQVESSSIEEATSTHYSSDAGPDKDGFYHRKVSPGRRFSWMNTDYYIGKAHVDEEIRLQILENTLVVQDAKENLVKTFDIPSTQGKNIVPKKSFASLQVGIQAAEPVVLDETSFAEPDTKISLEHRFLPQQGPDKDGFYHRTVQASGRFWWGCNRYSLGRSRAGKSIRIQVLEKTLYVFDEMDNLLKILEI